MQDLLKRTKNYDLECINNNWVPRKINDGIPLYLRSYYYGNLNFLIDILKRMIANVFGTDKKISIPISIDYLTNYLSGFDFKFIPVYEFENEKIEGFSHWDRKNDIVNIYYKAKSTYERQRNTKIHEIIHFCQMFEPDFINKLRDIREEKMLPEYLIRKLLERATEKATAMYLMPNYFFEREYSEIIKKRNDLYEVVDDLSKIFEVSKLATIFRLKECGKISQSQVEALVY